MTKIEIVKKKLKIEKNQGFQEKTKQRHDKNQDCLEKN